MTRPGWDDYFLGIAQAVAARGDCLRCKVGAVLVETDTHRIISTGYNGSPPGGPSCLAGECPRCLSNAPSGSSYEGCVEVHAERNCIDWYDTSDQWRYLLYRHTLYVTRDPCTVCLPYLQFRQIGRIVY